MTHVVPDVEQLTAFAEAATADDGPIVMLNLNRYRDVARYPDGWDGAERSGRDAYRYYAAVAVRGLAEVGGRPLWMADAAAPLVGCDHDAWDEVLAVWYPNRAAFVTMTQIPWYVEALVHRDAALERAALLPCVAGSEPVLGLGLGAREATDDGDRP